MKEFFILSFFEFLNILEFQNYIFPYLHKVFVAPRTINERIRIKLDFSIGIAIYELIK